MRQNLADQRRLGRKIRTLRLRAKLTQEALAELASTSSKHIGDIERGNVDVGFGVLTRIARAFSVDIAVLAGWPVKTAGKALLTAEQKTQIDQTIQLLQRLLLLGS
jgi:transcriptional regulator with XRE-family HTH domain